MYLNTDYITPQELTGYVRESLANRPQNQFQLARYLPNRNVDDIEYRFVNGGEGLADAAVYRAFDAESPIGNRPGLTRVTGDLPPISRKVRLGEYDRLRLRQDPNALIRNGLLSDAERMALSVSARVELARGDALVTGKINLNENGVIATVDFGRASGHTVSAGTVWTTYASATVIDDLLAWQATYLATNGVLPERIVTSSAVVGYIMRNAQIKAMVASAAGTPSVVTRTAVNAVLDSYGLPPIEVNDEQVNVAGSATRIIPADKVLLLPAPTDPNDELGTQLGATAWGTTAESLEPDYGVVGDEAGIVAGAYRSNDPIAVWTKAAAIALPVLANPNLSFCADVA